MMWTFSSGSRSALVWFISWFVRPAGPSNSTEKNEHASGASERTAAGITPTSRTSTPKPSESSTSSSETLLSKCLELNCDAEAKVEGECYGSGVDFDGADAVFVLDKYRCTKGHFYHVVNEDKSVTLRTRG
jgi:hypothetical protein